MNRISPTPEAAAPRHALGLGPALAWGAAIGLAMSTQLLFQPFVWRHYAWDEVLDGWLALAGQRLAVTLPIAAAIALATRARADSPAARALLLGAAILAGALVGEFALVANGSLTAPAGLAALGARVVQWLMLAGSVSSLFYLWRRATVAGAAAQATELRRIRLEREVVQARLQTLRSQIEPHFLFNTLATVRRLHQTDGDECARLLAHFLDYLRSTLPERATAGATLGQEIDLVRAYLGVVSVRMGGRLTADFDVPDALLACEFPPLTIATLVENAIKHGIAPAPQGGAIEVRARREGDVLEVRVADTGVGFSGSGGSGIGLANIRARLRTLYGAGGTLALAANEPRGVRASMRLPCSFVAPEGGAA